LPLKRHRNRVTDGWSIRVASGKKKKKDSNTYYLQGPREEPAAGEASADGRIPFMTTAAMKEKLRELNFTDEQIANLTPQEAHEILGKPKDAARRDAGAGEAEELEPM